MSHYESIAVAVGAVLLLLMLFRATRALVSLVFGIVTKAITWAASMLSSFLHKFMGTVLRAHITFFRNFFPRASVIPSVREKTTKRI